MMLPISSALNAHRVCADVAEGPYLKQAHRPRFIVGELAHGNDVVLANRPEQLTYSAARALDELREILRAARAVLVVLDALLGPVDQRHVSRHACPPLVLADFKTIVCPGKHRRQGRCGVLLSASSQIRNADRGWRSQVCTWDFAVERATVERATVERATVLCFGTLRTGVSRHRGHAGRC